MGVQLTNVERLAMEAMASAFDVSSPIDYLAWAEQNVTIGEGSFQGPYNRGLFPYFDEILRALSPDDPCRYVSLIGSAQIGKTTIAGIFTCGSLVLGRGAFLYAHPTDENARRWSRMKLAPLMRSTAAVRDLFPQRSRDGADAVLFKERRDGLTSLLITGANSPASLSQVTIQFQCQDDLSKWEMNAAGDPEAQADNRSRAVEWQLVGFGKEYRRYVVDYGIIPNHISNLDCQQNLDALLARKWKNSVGRQLGLNMTAIDGNAYTEDVWGWVRRHPASKVIMVRGRGEDGVPRLALVRRERNERTGMLLKYSSRFYNLGVSNLKMALYRDLAKDDPLEPGYVALPSGLDDEYFRELTAERRVAKKRHGFEIFAWEKDDKQDNEALDTIIQATGAALKYGVYGFSEVHWMRLEAERETPPQPDQGDLEDFLLNEPKKPLFPGAPIAQLEDDYL
jgi:phage terminase large subunit GpA-like protein